MGPRGYQRQFRAGMHRQTLSRVSGLRARIVLPTITLSGRFSHWSTLKTVYSRIISAHGGDIDALSESLSRYHLILLLKFLPEHPSFRNAFAALIPH